MLVLEEGGCDRQLGSEGCIIKTVNILFVADALFREDSKGVLSFTSMDISLSEYNIGLLSS